MVVRRQLTIVPLGLALLVLAGLPATLDADPPGNQAKTPKADGSSEKSSLTAADKLSMEEQRIADKFLHLDAVLERIVRLTEANDPRRAALMQKARRQVRERMIALRFERLVIQLRDDKLSQAMENQEILGQDLRALLELLMSENRAKRVEAEKARIRRYLKRINRIIRKQKDVQGRTAGGGGQKGLSGEQGKLAKDTGKLAKDIKQNEEPESGTQTQGKGGGKAEGESQKGEGQGKGKGEGKGEGKGKGKGEGQGQGQGQGQSQGQEQDQDGNPVRKRLEAAQQRMEEAQKKLDQAKRTGAVEQQEEAIRELEQAKAELEEILRQLREEEIARMLAMLEARFRKMLTLQREVYEGTLRLDKVPKSQRSNNHEIEASRLSGKEQQIVVEADNALLLLREDGTAVAFPEAVEQMRDDMQQVVHRLARARVDQITQAIEEDILAALEEMIEALKKAQEDLEQGKPPPGQQQGRPQDPPLVDVLAELKMIRALQMRVNRRTERYSKLIEGEQAERAELLDALKRLAERERRIYRVTRDLELGKNQ